MIFNVGLRFILIACLSTGLFGCSEFLKGKPAKQETLEIKTDELSCLSTINNQFKKIIHSESSEIEINEAFKCIDQTLNQFQTRIEGRSAAESFTDEELYIIFNKFQKNTSVSREAAKNILILKKALFGGSDEIITKIEIEHLGSYLIILRQEVQKLAPYMTLYAFNKSNGPYSRQTIDLAFTQLKSSLKVLLSQSKIVRSGYEFDDLKKLLLSLNIVEDDQKDLIDVAEKVKDLLLGIENINVANDYELAIDNFLDLMSLCSYVLYNDVQFEIKNEKQLDKVVDFVDRVVNLLSQSVQFQKKSQIQITALDPIIDVILKKNLLSFQIESSTFKSFYKKVLIKVFNDQKNISIDSLDAIKLVNINSIKKELAVFKLYLDFINSNHFQSDIDRQKINVLQEKMKLYDVRVNTKILSNFSLEDQLYVIAGFEELRTEFVSKRPVVYRFKKMIVAVNQDIWDLSWEDMTRAHYGKMLARELLRGWGDSTVILEPGLTEWYSDFKQFAIEAKAFDPRPESIKTARETFLQSNLFTYDGNGDKEMSKTEAFQYINMLISGGSQTFQEIREGLARVGCNLAEKDVFGYAWNDEKCFYEDFKKNYKYYFSNLSYLVSYLAKLSEAEFKSYYDSVMIVARRDIKTVGRIESADIRTLSMTLMYIESLFANFDKNNNWTFSASEIRTAYPRFTDFVTEYAQKNAKNELAQWDVVINPCRPLYPLPAFIKEAFIFMAYNGRLPNEVDLNNPSNIENIYECGKYQLGFDSLYQPFTFKGEIDRKTIINTFKVLKSALESK